MTEPVGTWQLKDARANFSTLVDKAISDGPQIVTRNGKKAVVVVSMEEWMRRDRRHGDSRRLLCKFTPARRGDRS
jgi:prevent-host-death family protein